MRIRGKGVLALVMGLVVAGLLGTSSVSAAPPATSNAKSEHQRIVDFWTHDRVAKAKPRDFVYDPASGRFVPSEKAKGGKPGTGGGTTTTVTGASWPNGDTLVRKTTGKVLFAFGSDYFVCSASLARDPQPGPDRAVILTAAHCVYDEVADVFADKWTFIPDYDSAPAPLSGSNETFCPKTKYGCWTATKLIVHDGYAAEEGFTKDALPYDFAFAVVGEGGRTDDALSPDADAALGFQEIDFDDRPSKAHAFGYPAAGRYNGQDLVYCTGSLGNDLVNGNDTYAMSCGMTGGSSGGPWLQNLADGAGTLISVNSYGYSTVKNMYGPKLNGSAYALYTASATAETDRVVTGEVPVPKAA